jgi:hypothetical protein
MRACVSTLSPRLKLPLQLPIRSIDGVQVAIVSHEVHQSVGHSRRRSDTAFCCENPLLFAGYKVDRIKVSVSAPDIYDSGGNCGGGENHPARLKLPFHSAEIHTTRGGIDSTVLQITTEHRSICTE